MLFAYYVYHVPHIAVWKKLLQCILIFAYERLLNAAVYQKIVRFNARLSGVEHLAEGYPARSQLYVRRFIHYCGAFAAQLQRNRRKMLRRRLHNGFAHLHAAGKEYVIELFFKQRLIFRPAALNGGNVFRWECVAYQLGYGGACSRGIGGRLYHCAVARGYGAYKRIQAKLHGVIPRRNNERHAVRLGRDEAFCRKLSKRRFDPPFLGPLGNVLYMVAQFLQYHARFAHVAFCFGFVQILLQRIGKQLLVRAYCPLKLS